MPDMFKSRRAGRRRLGYLIGSAMLIAGIAASGTAQAAVRAPVTPSCKPMSGTTGAKPSGDGPSGGTTFIVNCRNPTLLWANRVDLFKGWLWLSSGRWQACRANIYYPPCPPHHIVLCGDVAPGTLMMVVARNSGSAAISVGV